MKKGFTLLETIVVIAVMGVAIPTLLMAFARIVATGADAATVTVETNLAEEKMEELIRGTSFAKITSAGPSDFSGSFSAYNYQIIVDYVDAANFDVSVAPDDDDDNEDDADSPTDFKRIRVIASKDGSSVSSQISTVLSNLGY